MYAYFPYLLEKIGFILNNISETPIFGSWSVRFLANKKSKTKGPVC